MEEMINYVVKSLVQFPDEVKISKTEDGNQIDFLVEVNSEDMGRVIGKGGKVANAMRVVARALASREHKRVNIKIGND